MKIWRLILLVVLWVFVTGVHPVLAAPQHAVSMHGTPKYGAEFTHFDYVNPYAPKGGRMTLSKVGTFDSLNPFVIRGVPAEGRKLSFESLMTRSKDEPFGLYGLIARRLEVPDDRSWVIFTLDSRARFHDGTPVRVSDVIFSLNILRDRGRPNHHYYYSQVTRIEDLGDGRVKFTFNTATAKAGAKGTGDRELPLILALMPILPEQYFKDRPFDTVSLEPIPGSGPYRVSAVEPGRSITYTRDPGYWGRDLPVNQGRFNFDTVRFDYYRDDATALEAFKAGLIDIREELSPAKWASAYEGPAKSDGHIVMRSVPHGRPAGMLGLVFNTRHALFADRSVRRALIKAFDFEWMNRNLFHGAYVRTQSYFGNSELAAPLEPGAHERALFNHLGAGGRAETLSPLPRSDGSGHNRNNLAAAQKLLSEAGWRVSEGALCNAAGEPFAFEIMLADPSNLRVAQQFSRDLLRLGITATIRQVDTSQYVERAATYDYDMMVYFWDQSLSPGNEQDFYWGTDSADQEGTRNYMGVRDPLIDKLIDEIKGAKQRPALVTATRALDRVLRVGKYVIPLYHLPADHIAYWRRFGIPEFVPLEGYATETWWTETSP